MLLSIRINGLYLYVTKRNGNNDHHDPLSLFFLLQFFSCSLLYFHAVGDTIKSQDHSLYSTQVVVNQKPFPFLLSPSFCLSNSPFLHSWILQNDQSQVFWTQLLTHSPIYIYIYTYKANLGFVWLFPFHGPVDKSLLLVCTSYWIHHRCHFLWSRWYTLFLSTLFFKLLVFSPDENI